MTAQVQLYRALKDDKLTEPDRIVAMNRAVALYERARQLPVPKEVVRDAADAQANLVYTYIMAERPQQAGQEPAIHQLHVGQLDDPQRRREQVEAIVDHH